MVGSLLVGHFGCPVSSSAMAQGPSAGRPLDGGRGVVAASKARARLPRGTDPDDRPRRGRGDERKKDGEEAGVPNSADRAPGWLGDSPPEDPQPADVGIVGQPEVTADSVTGPLYVPSDVIIDELLGSEAPADGSISAAATEPTPPDAPPTGLRSSADGPIVETPTTGAVADCSGELVSFPGQGGEPVRCRPVGGADLATVEVVFKEGVPPDGCAVEVHPEGDGVLALHARSPLKPCWAKVVATVRSGEDERQAGSVLLWEVRTGN